MADFGGKTVAVDFDGVLHSYDSGWTGPIPADPPIDGALEFVHTLIANGAKVIVYTTRAAEAEGYSGIINWLDKHGFPQLEVSAMKPVAVAYVDDRAVRFQRSATGHGNWVDVMQQCEDLLNGRVHGHAQH